MTDLRTKQKVYQVEYLYIPNLWYWVWLGVAHICLMSSYCIRKYQNTIWTHCIPLKPLFYLYTFYSSLCAAWVFQLFETLKAALISHHAPLCCLWTHGVRIVKYVQCFSVVHCRQLLLDLFMSGGWWCVQGNFSCSFLSQTVKKQRKF